MDTSILFIAFLVLMIVNTVIALMTLRIQMQKQPRKTEDPEIVRCKIAAMQLFAGIGKLMELMEDGRKWNKNRSAYVIKEMEQEKERITNPEVKRDGFATDTYSSKRIRRDSLQTRRS